MLKSTQTFMLLSVFTILLSGCSSAKAFVSMYTAPDDTAALLELAEPVQFPDAFAIFNAESDEVKDYFLVRNNSQILLDTYLLSDAKLTSLSALITDSAPVPAPAEVTPCDRGYIVEWSRGDHVLVMLSGLSGDKKHTLLLLDDAPYLTDLSVYTAWVESFATAK